MTANGAVPVGALNRPCPLHGLLSPSLPGFPGSNAIGQEVGVVKLSTAHRWCPWAPGLPGFPPVGLEFMPMEHGRVRSCKDTAASHPSSAPTPPPQAGATVLNTFLAPSSPGPIPSPHILELLPTRVPGFPPSRCYRGRFSSKYIPTVKGRLEGSRDLGRGMASS